MNDRSSWTVTTHDWRKDLDVEHLAEVRERLGTAAAAGGRRHLILEVLAYADEEAASQGRTGTAAVTVLPDGRVTIADDGRGTDTRRDSQGRVVRKPVMATADLRFRDESAAPLLPDGLPRRGMSTVAALSSELVHENHRGAESWSQTYRYGIPDKEWLGPHATAHGLISSIEVSSKTLVSHTRQHVIGKSTTFRCESNTTSVTSGARPHSRLLPPPGDDVRCPQGRSPGPRCHLRLCQPGAPPVRLAARIGEPEVARLMPWTPAARSPALEPPSTSPPRWWGPVGRPSPATMRRQLPATRP